MPTGYTAILLEREVSFEEFVWNCARAFGAFIHMRDDRAGAPLREPDNGDVQYHANRIAEDTEEREEIRKLTPHEAMERSRADHDRAVTETRAANARYDREDAVFEAMRRRVLEWTPPTKGHDGMREFMIDQLNRSKNEWRMDEPKPLFGEEWRAAHVKRLDESIDYHEREMAAAQKRHDERITWINQLRASVPQPKVTP